MGTQTVYSDNTKASFWVEKKGRAELNLDLLLAALKVTDCCLTKVGGLAVVIRLQSSEYLRTILDSCGVSGTHC